MKLFFFQVIACFNLVALALSDSIMAARGVYSLERLSVEVQWLANVFRSLGAIVDIGSKSPLDLTVSG